MGRTINTILPVLMAGMIAVSALGSYGCAKKYPVVDTAYRAQKREDCRKHWWQGSEERNCSGDPRPDTPYNR